MRTQIYLGNLPKSMTEKQIKMLISNYGYPAYIVMGMSKDVGKFQGYAFITMETLEEAEAAVLGLNGMIFGGRELVCKMPSFS